MVQPVSQSNAATGAGALSGIQPVDLSSLQPEPAPVKPGIFNIPPEQQQALVAAAFVDNIAAHPELLDMTVEDAAKRFPDIPPGALQKSIDSLVSQYGKKGLTTTDDNGDALSLGKILQQLPQIVGGDEAKKAVGAWFKDLKEGPQALIVAIAAASYLGKEGVQGLGKLGISLDVAKLPGDEGKVSIGLTTNPKTGSGTEVKLGGTVTAKSGTSNATATATIDTTGAYLLKAAVNLVSGSRTYTLGATRSTADGQVYKIGYNGKNASLTATSTNGSVGVTAAYKINDQVTVDAGLNVTDPAPGANPQQNANYGRIQYVNSF